MMYPYMTLSDGTEIVHSHLITEKNPPEIEVNFECPIDGGFKSARCVLPSYTWINNEGYSKEEIGKLNKDIISIKGKLDFVLKAIEAI